MILPGVGLLAVDSSRTRAYLAALHENDLIPAHAIFLTGGPNRPDLDLPPVPYFDNSVPAQDMLQEMGIATQVLDTSDVNSPEAVAAVRDSGADVLIYSGPGGAILRRDLFDTGKRFLHIHPGLVPHFRGSTTVYYSLLVEGTCGVSAMFLNEQIDQGPVLATRTFPPPADRTSIDHGYDPYIRSTLLVQVLQDFEARGEWRSLPQGQEAGETYFIMHPVLRHLAILSKFASEETEEEQWQATAPIP